MKRQTLGKTLFNQRHLLLLSVPFVLWLIVFKYIPLVGWLMAFQDFKPHLGLFHQKWVGLKNFQDVFSARLFYLSLQNTIGMSILGLIFGTGSAILFALLLNELRGSGFKRFTQTVSYLPHFVSWVIVANIVTTIMSPSGFLNEVLIYLGVLKEPINFMTKPDMFWGLVVVSDIWKETGWNAIIYLAAMTGIDSQLYEAAQIDGANRLQRILKITIPGISSTVILVLIMSVGNLINIGFEKQWLLGNSVVQDKSLVLDKFIIDYGVGLNRYAFGTAVGMFKSVVSVALLLIANQLAKRSGEKLF
jgi:putative aldouronate transport system permease protein